MTLWLIFEKWLIDLSFQFGLLEILFEPSDNLRSAENLLVQWSSIYVYIRDH